MAGPMTQISTAASLGSVAGWSSFTGGDDLERVPELQWPSSVYEYYRMLNDAQVASLMDGFTLPIRAYRWYIDGNGAPDSAVQRISADYNLPIGKLEPGMTDDDFNHRRAQRRFSFDKHLEDALRALVYGHYPFEQVGEYLPGDKQWHLRKLAPIPPRTIWEINVADDGGLRSVRQLTAKANDPPIPVNRLVMYTWDREGGVWTGRSFLRRVYRNFLLKDRVLRVGAINIERAGGVPYVEAPEGASGDQIKALDRLARRFRVGEGAGAALPHGAQLKFAMAAGGDGAVAYIKQQNEEMARAFLQMVNMLGQTNSGSRALGSTFQDIAQIAQWTIAKWFADTFNEHVIEDDVEFNEGPDTEYAPKLCFQVGEAHPLQGLQEGVQSGEVQVEPGGEADQAINEPAKKPAARKPAVKKTASRRARGVRAGGVATPQETSPLPLPPRPLRRAPNQQEIQASVNFAAMDSSFDMALQQLQAEVGMARQFQADELRDAITAANGSLSKIANITTDVSASDRILAHLKLVAQQAIDMAVTEARAQGVTVDRQGVDDLIAPLQARASAVDSLLTGDFVQSATRQAVRLTGGGLSPQEVGNDTHAFLLGLTGAVAADILGGAVQQAINAGRKLVYARDGQEGTLVASEILDVNTCDKCVAKDGTVYASLEEAERDYPTGGYKDCDGRERCRGTILKVYTNVPTSTASPFEVAAA